MPAGALLYQPNDDLLANEMTIEELYGQKRKVTLRGAGLPFMGAGWGVHQNAPTTWFPGNPEASQQVLGGQLLPSDWEGRWARTMLGRSPCYVGTNLQSNASGAAVVNPATLAGVFESISLAGSRIRVKWRNRVREGRMTEFVAKQGKTTDVEWSAKFDWMNRGHAVDQRVQGVRGGNVTGELDAAGLEADIAANMELTWLTVSTRPDKLPKGTPTMTLGQIGALIDSPRKMLSGFCRQCRSFSKSLQQVAALVNQARSLPASLANTLMNEEENMLAISNSVIDSLSRQTPEQLAVRTNATAVVRNASYYGAAVRQATVVAGKCADVRQSLGRTRAEASGSATGDNRAAAQPSDVLTMHAVKQGETLVSISFAYYDTPDHAYDIALCNHLPYPCPPDASGLSLGGKRTLIIPALKGQGA